MDRIIAETEAREAKVSIKIKDTVSAQQYLDSVQVKPPQFDGETVRIPNPCGRCGGSGRYPSSMYRGVCLKCGGAYTVNRVRELSLVEFAREVKSKIAGRARAKKKRLEWERATTGTGETFAERDARRQQERVEAEQRRLEERERKAAASRYVGVIGEKLELTVTVTHMAEFEGQYGLWTLVGMEDTAGNALVWWATGRPGVKRGDRRVMHATVKKHEPYRGACQTTVTRAKFEDVGGGVSAGPVMVEHAGGLNRGVGPCRYGRNHRGG